MIPLPDADWLVAANHTHEPVWQVDMVAADGTVMAAALPFVDGQYTIDQERACDLSIDVPAGPVPELLSEDFLPLGHRLRLSYRIEPWTDSVVVADLDLVASALARPENVWTLAASDQTRRIGRDDLDRGQVNIGAGDTIAQAVTELVTRTFPAAQLDITGRVLSEVIPAKADYQYDAGSPWDLVRELVLGSGAVAWQDPGTRVFHVEDITTDGPAVDTLAVGDGGNIHRYTIEHQMSYNHSVVTYIDDTPNPSVVVGQYEDRRPTSPCPLTGSAPTSSWGRWCGTCRSTTCRRRPAPTTPRRWRSWPAVPSCGTLR